MVSVVFVREERGGKGSGVEGEEDRERELCIRPLQRKLMRRTSS